VTCDDGQVSSHHFRLGQRKNGSTSLTTFKNILELELARPLRCKTYAHKHIGDINLGYLLVVQGENGHHYNDNYLQT
jgi:hypothetical protein